MIEAQQQTSTKLEEIEEELAELAELEAQEQLSYEDAQDKNELLSTKHKLE